MFTDPDQTASSIESDLDLHCLPTSDNYRICLTDIELIGQHEANLTFEC